MKRIKDWPFHLMILPSLLFLIVFNYVPMLGIVISFQDFKPWLGITGSPWVGWDNFKLLFERQDSVQVIWNTFIIAGLKIVFNLLVPFIFALLLNEITKSFLSRTIYTLVYLPQVVSCVILGGIFVDILSTDGDLDYSIIMSMLGIYPIAFLSIGNLIRFTAAGS